MFLTFIRGSFQYPVIASIKKGQAACLPFFSPLAGRLADGMLYGQDFSIVVVVVVAGVWFGPEFADGS